MTQSEFGNLVATFGFTEKLVGGAIHTIPPRQWLERPARPLNHVLWLVGHLATTRALIVHMLTQRAGKPDLDARFAGGMPLHDDSRFPAAADVVGIWTQSGARLQESLTAVSTDTLQRPVPSGGISFDGTIGGMLAGAAFHEAYHTGQLGYLTRWLGHPSLLEGLQRPT